MLMITQIPMMINEYFAMLTPMSELKTKDLKYMSNEICIVVRTV